MKKTLTKKELAWEIINYVSLALCIFGQVTVGYLFMIAQIAYLIANVLGLVRDFVLKFPASNKVRDAVFTGITVALIVIRLL